MNLCVSAAEGHGCPVGILITISMAVQAMALKSEDENGDEDVPKAMPPPKEAIQQLTAGLWEKGVLNGATHGTAPEDWVKQMKAWLRYQVVPILPQARVFLRKYSEAGGERGRGGDQEGRRKCRRL